MRRLAALLCTGVLLGCGAGEEEAEPPTAPAGTITVVVRPEGEGGPERRREIDCPGARLCDRIARASFAPVPEGVACTQIYGGPATATVRGTIGDRRIDAEFSLQNGCEINRWEQHAWLLGDPPAGLP